MKSDKKMLNKPFHIIMPKVRFQSALILIVFVCSCGTDAPSHEMAIQTEIREPAAGKPGEIIGPPTGCGFNYSPNSTSLSVELADAREKNQINSILSFSGLVSNFVVYKAPIDNAIATIINNKRYILYDPKLLAFSDVKSGSYWSSMSILAHEIGHHLSGHTLGADAAALEAELEADKFSGFVLYKLGATLDEATMAMKQLGSESDSRSHPSKYKRIKAISDGWANAASQRYSSAIPPPPADDNTFSADGYIKEEFGPNELVSSNALSAENFGGLIKQHDGSYLEGIIIDVVNDDPTGGGRAEYFSDQQNLSKVLTIELTRHSDNAPDSKVGERKKYHLIDYYQMVKADLSWLEALLVPGRKIRFKTLYFGYGEEDIFYLKKLYRNESTNKDSSGTASHNINSYQVISARTYFHSEANEDSKRNAYLVNGEFATGSVQQNRFVYVTFRNLQGKETKGWLKLEDLK